MHCDCQAAITIAKNKTSNGKNQCIRLRHNVIKQLLKDGIIFIDYVKLDEFGLSYELRGMGQLRGMGLV